MKSDIILLTIFCAFVSQHILADDEIPENVRQFCREEVTRLCIDNQTPSERSLVDSKTDNSIQTPTEKNGKLESNIGDDGKTTTTTSKPLLYKSKILQRQVSADNENEEGNSEISGFGNHRRDLLPPGNVTECWIEETEKCINALRRRDGGSCLYEDVPMEDEICVETLGCYFIQYFIQVIFCSK